MKRIIAFVFGFTLLAGVFGVVAASAEPGPKESNKHGLCTAYFNGQKNGHEGGSPKPFANLENAADEADGEEDANSGDAFETAADVFGYCEGLIGGNMTNGRFDCAEGEEEGTFTCEDGGGPGAEGKGKGKPEA